MTITDKVESWWCVGNDNYNNRNRNNMSLVVTWRDNATLETKPKYALNCNSNRCDSNVKPHKSILPWLMLPRRIFTLKFSIKSNEMSYYNIKFLFNLFRSNTVSYYYIIFCTINKIWKRRLSKLYEYHDDVLFKMMPIHLFSITSIFQYPFLLCPFLKYWIHLKTFPSLCIIDYIDDYVEL